MSRFNFKNNIANSSATANFEAGYQLVNMTVDYRGFSPNTFNIQKGIPVRWQIDAKELTGCNNEIIMPALKIDKKLSPGQNIIEFTPNKVGTLNFSCWMGMLRGKFIVTENSGDLNLNDRQPGGLAVNNYEAAKSLNAAAAGCGCANTF